MKNSDSKKNAEYLEAGHVIRNLKRRGIDAIYVPTKEEALEMIRQQLPSDAVVSWGGSVTLEEVGLLKYLRESGIKLIDRSITSDYRELRALFSQAILADVYFMSTNAVTLDGELVNIDGNGNRVAAMIYGPEHVVILAGVNKIAVSVEEAVRRIRNEAAPANAQRLDYKTGCRKTGYCTDCMTEECMCGQIVVTRYARIKGRMHLILIGENLGY